MICKRCNAQFPDHSQFCFHCGLPVNAPPGGMPFQQQPFGQPQNFGAFPPVNDSGPAEPKEKQLFQLGLIAFCTIGFWFLLRLLGRMMGGYEFYRYQKALDFLNILTSAMVPLFAMIFVKNKNLKTPLIVFFILTILLGFLDKFVFGYMDMF